jgi:hypothetical protein
MKTADALAFYKDNGATLARAAGVSRQAMYQWGEYVPEAVARRLDELTGGRLAFKSDDYVKVRKAFRRLQARNRLKVVKSQSARDG